MITRGDIFQDNKNVELKLNNLAS